MSYDVSSALAKEASVVSLAVAILPSFCAPFSATARSEDEKKDATIRKEVVRALRLAEAGLEEYRASRPMRA